MQVRENDTQKTHYEYTLASFEYLGNLQIVTTFQGGAYSIAENLIEVRSGRHILCH
jgi:hypothetical protein